MRIACEAPVGNTSLALASSDFIFAIAPMLKIPEYAQVIRQSRAVGKELYIDNGEYEGQRMDVDEYLALCLEWKPRVVVAPDVILDCDKTIELSREFLRKLPLNGSKRRPFEIMVVLQGRSAREKMDCYWTLMKEFDFEVVGLGLGAFEKRWKDRFFFLQNLECCRGRLHVLGVANIHDLCFWKGIAETVDTSLPFHLAQEGKTFFGKKETKHLNWSDTLKDSRLALAEQNCEAIRELLENV